MQAIVCHAPKDLRVEAEEHAAALTSGQLRVRVARGGICGSDLHYYQHGGFGAVRLKEPMVLGHEISAVIEEVGDPQSVFSVGQRISVSPSRPCGGCTYCHEGMPNHCLNMRFYGSAMPFPHVQGARRMCWRRRQPWLKAHWLSRCQWGCTRFSARAVCSASVFW